MKDVPILKTPLRVNFSRIEDADGNILVGHSLDNRPVSMGEMVRRANAYKEEELVSELPELPPVGSRWEIDAEYDESKGPRNAYTVLFVTNLDHLSNKYPPQVVYRGDNGRLWSRPLGKWPGRLRRIPSVADLVIAGVERPFSERDQQDLDAVAEAAISYGQENPLRVADGCDPEFMAALERGDHLRAAGATEEQIAKVKEIGKKFPFSGADQIDLGMCEELVETSQYQQDGYTSCGAVAVALVDGRPKCALHARRVDKNDTQRSPS